MVAKICHAILQFLLFFLLPFIYIPAAASDTVANPKDLIVENSVRGKGYVWVGLPREKKGI